MFEEDILLLGHRYRRLNDPNETVGIGDLVHFNPPLDRDAEWYMFRFDYKYDAMVLVNWIGYEAGLEHAVAQIKRTRWNRTSLATASVGLKRTGTKNLSLNPLLHRPAFTSLNAINGWSADERWTRFIVLLRYQRHRRAAEWRYNL